MADQPSGNPARHATPWVALEAALVVLAAALVAWLGSQADVFTIDSYYYLSKAKSLAHGSWLTVPWGDGIDRKFFWGYSIALALPLRLFGESGFWILAALLTVWVGAVAARILRRLPLPPAARVAALALALFNPVALWWSTVPMSEALMEALALTSALFALRYRASGVAREALLAAVFGGLAFLTRVEGAFVALVLVALCGARLVRERRWGLFAACVLIFGAFEATHVAYLRYHALESRGLIAYLDEAKGHFHEFNFLDAVWRHVRAPFWLIFRFDTERWLYERYFPGWLIVAQGAIAATYLATFALVLLAGLVRRAWRGPAFAAALAILAFAVLHSAWYYAYERYDYLIYPAAALVLACGLDALFSRTRPRVRQAAVLALGLGLASIGGVYGAQLSRMHAARLALHQRQRDYRGIAKAVNAANPERRPVVTELGPYLAFYLDGRALFDRHERDFFDDVVPTGEEGRIFLARQRVAVIAEQKAPWVLARELGLVEGEYHQVPAPGATVLVLDF